MAAFIAEEGQRVIDDEGLTGFCAVFEGATELPGKLPMARVCAMSGLFLAQTSGERPPSSTRAREPLLRHPYLGSCLTRHVLDAHFIDCGGFDDPIARLLGACKD